MAVVRIYEQILSVTNDTFRFERFSVELVSAAEDVSIWPTSQNYDLGADGAATEILLGATTTKLENLESKAEEDAQKAAKNFPNIKTYYYTVSRSITEHRKKNLQASISYHLPGETNVVVFGGVQLSAMSEQNVEIVNKHYGSEIEQIQAWLKESGRFNGNDSALRLALMTFSQQESSLARDEAYDVLCLSALSDTGRTMNHKELSNRVSSELRLGRSLPIDVIAPAIERLSNSGRIEYFDNRFTITEAGQEYLSDQITTGSRAYLHGRESIRTQIEEATGHTFSDDQYSRIWKAVEQRLIEELDVRGDALIGLACELVNENIVNFDPEEYDDLASLAHSLGEAAAATCDFEPQAEEVRVAFNTIFWIRGGAAYEWLIDTCSRYILVCSLGLERQIGSALKSLFHNTDFFLDTDIVLTLLCAGEPEHLAVSSAAKRLHELGGRIWASRPVLEELARHAWIAQNDFDNTRQFIFPRVTNDAASIIENAFVRAFAELAKGNRRPGRFESYIKLYRGRSKYDFKKISKALASDFEMAVDPVLRDCNQDIFEHLKGEIRKLDDVDFDIAEDKARRDAEFVESARLQNEKSDGAVFIVTSSSRLRRAISHCTPGGMRRALGLPQLVYLMSMIPEVHLSFGGMRALLFDDNVRSKFSSAQRLATRVIAGSDEYNIPLAKRFQMLEEIESAVHDSAIRYGESQKGTTDDAADSKDEEVEALATLIAKKMDKYAVTSETQKRLWSLEEEVERLRKELSKKR